MYSVSPWAQADFYMNITAAMSLNDIKTKNNKGF